MVRGHCSQRWEIGFGSSEPEKEITSGLPFPGQANGLITNLLQKRGITATFSSDHVFRGERERCSILRRR